MIGRVRSGNRVAALVAWSLSFVAAACGTDTPAIEFDSTTPRPATTVPVTTTPSSGSAPTVDASAPSPVQTGSEWVDVTANLVGLDSECGNMSFLSSRPDRDMLIAGIADQGLWASENGSDQWTPLGRASGSAVIDNRPTSIIYDPADPNRFWESGAYGAGVFETVDNGTTFRRLGDVEHSDLVSVDLADPARRTLLSGTHEQRRVLRSTDGGASWQNISGSLPPNVGFATFPHVIGPETYLLGTKSGQASGVLRTTDGGTTWSLVYQGGVSGPPMVSRSDGQIAWLLEEGGGLITSSDQGVTWTETLSWGPAGGTAGSLIELPDGRLATLGPSNIVISADRGARWQAIGPNLPFEPTGMTYSPFRGAFYVWRFVCDLSLDRNPIDAGAIMRLDADLGSV